MMNGEYGVVDPRWLRWVKELRSIAQAGLTYAESPFDRHRYQQVLDIATEIAATYSATDFETVRGLFSAAQGYETPKVDVRGVVLQEGRLLLVQELMDGGRWTLPGGWADVNDTPTQAVEREVWEETGFKVRATRLLAAYDRRLHGHTPPAPYGIYKLFFLCTLLEGTSKPSIETTGARFFAEHEIPEALSLGRVTPEEITRLLELARHPEWPADID